jgi:hypothetical protein
MDEISRSISIINAIKYARMAINKHLKIILVNVQNNIFFNLIKFFLCFPFALHARRNVCCALELPTFSVMNALLGFIYNLILFSILTQHIARFNVQADNTQAILQKLAFFAIIYAARAKILRPNVQAVYKQAQLIYLTINVY